MADDVMYCVACVACECRRTWHMYALAVCYATITLVLWVRNMLAAAACYTIKQPTWCYTQYAHSSTGACNALAPPYELGCA